VRKAVVKKAIAVAIAITALVVLEDVLTGPSVNRWFALRDPARMMSLASREWVQSEPGSMPLVILVPHDGEFRPRGLPDRVCNNCLDGKDSGTGEMARLIADAIEARVGRRPFVVRNLLYRRKFDANRERLEATAGVREVMPIWERWHARIDEAKRAALNTNPRALVLDLHAHGHDVQRIELGYLIGPQQLALSDELLAIALPASSIAAIDGVAKSGDRGAALLRGPLALGTLLSQAGYPAVPSASDPSPKSGEEYYTGGFNTERHGSRQGGNVDAIQVEMNGEGVLDSEADQVRFAHTFAGVLIQYLAEQYAWTPQ
jgi:hypothetical protein